MAAKRGRNKTKRQQRGRKKRPARKKKKTTSQRGGAVPWVVDFKKGYEVTKDMIKAVGKPIDEKKAKRAVAGYKAEYAAYKRQGGRKSFTSWAANKGYAKKGGCCIL